MNNFMEIELVGTASIYSNYNSVCSLVNEELLIEISNVTLKLLLKTNHNIEKIDKIV